MNHNNSRNSRNQRNQKWTLVTVYAVVKMITDATGKALMELGNIDREYGKPLQGLNLLVRSDLRHAAVKPKPFQAYLVQFDENRTVDGKLTGGQHIAMLCRLDLPTLDNGEIDPNKKVELKDLKPISWATRKDYDDAREEALEERRNAKNLDDRLNQEKNWFCHVEIPSMSVDIHNYPQNIADQLAILGLEIVGGVVKDAPEDMKWEVLNEVTGQFVPLGGEGEDSIPYLVPNKMVVDRHRPSGGINGAGAAFEGAKPETGKGAKKKARVTQAKGSNGATSPASETASATETAPAAEPAAAEAVTA